MLKYFYNLYFEYKDKSELVESFNIGYCSTLKKAQELIDTYKTKAGFNEYPIDCFIIQKVGVQFKNNITSKCGLPLFEVSHEYEEPDNTFNVTFFGLYESKEEAENEAALQSKNSPYKQYPNNFHIAQWFVDKSFEWEEGFSHYSSQQ